MSGRRLKRLGAIVGVVTAAVLATLLAGVSGYSSDAQLPLYMGAPRAAGFSLKTAARVLRNDGFTIGYSELRRDPLWVMYRAERIGTRHRYPRPEEFSVDERTLARVSSRDYSRSGYQRGHLAPNYIISELYGRVAQLQTFRMSNIAPQRPHLNEKLWQRLEEAEADYFVKWFPQVWVVTGPVFDEDVRRLRSGVEIPDAFYRIVVGIDGRDTPHLLAFVMPQEVRGDEPLDDYTVTVDEVERQTGLDFFSDLPDGVEEELESTSADESWKLLKLIARLPPRY